MIRNPLECFLSEINRMIVKSCLEYAPIKKIEEIKDLDTLFYKKMYPRWMSFHQRILDEYENPLLLIEYKIEK